MNTNVWVIRTARDAVLKPAARTSPSFDADKSVRGVWPYLSGDRHVPTEPLNASLQTLFVEVTSLSLGVPPPSSVIIPPFQLSNTLSTLWYVSNTPSELSFFFFKHVLLRSGSTSKKVQTARSPRIRTYIAHVCVTHRWRVATFDKVFCSRAARFPGYPCVCDTSAWLWIPVNDLT